MKKGENRRAHAPADVLRRCAILLAIVLLVCEVLPVSKRNRDHVQLLEVNDDGLFDTGDTYFAISADGMLVGWGSNRLNRIGGILPWRPYFARKTMAKNVISFSCGSTTAMYVDSDNVLWGWGRNQNLLFSDENGMMAPIGKTQIMQDVREVVVGSEYAAVVKTDGSLWTWGRNGARLGRGKPALWEENKYEAPQKIMDHVKSVKIVDGISFALTEDDALYTWGAGTYEPTIVAEQVKDIAYLGHIGNTWIYQYLTLDGTVFAFGFYSKFADGEHRQVAENVRSVFFKGMVKNDSTMWSWVCEDEEITPLKEKNGVWAALDKEHYMTDGGKFHLQIRSLPILRSTRTVVPTFRNASLLILAAYVLAQKIFAARDASGALQKTRAHTDT